MGLSASLALTNMIIVIFFLRKINTIWFKVWLLNILFHAGFLNNLLEGWKGLACDPRIKVKNMNTIHIV